MLLLQKSHFIRSLWDELNPARDANGDAAEEKRKNAEYMRHMLRLYASDASGVEPGVNVYIVREHESSTDATANDETIPSYDRFLEPALPLPGQRIVYVDGGFDLFSSGHIEFLRQVSLIERRKAEADGWHSSGATEQRIAAHGKDYERAHVVVGMHEDLEINRHKGGNYPIMNVFERGLCVLQCKVRFAIESTAVHANTKYSTYTPSSSGLPSRQPPNSFTPSPSSPCHPPPPPISQTQSTTAPQHSCPTRPTPTPQPGR